MYPRAGAQESIFVATVSAPINLALGNICLVYHIAPCIRHKGAGMLFSAVEDRPSRPSDLMAVAAVLDRKTRDVYPVGIRAALAECALRHAGPDGTDRMKVDRAVSWLRNTGHI